MAYTPISGIVPQLAKNAGGASASGYYLKGYVAGTTTPLSMGTDSTPTATLAKCKLNTRGEPISNDADETTVFIPHFNASYKIVLYVNTTDADNNTTANAVWVVDNITGVFDASDISYDANTTVVQKLNNLNAADYIELTAVDVTQLQDYDSIDVAYRAVEGDGGGGRFVWSTANYSAEVTLDAQSGIYVAPNSDATGASGCFVRADITKIYSSFFGSKEDWDGATGTDDSTAEQAAIDYCIASEVDLHKKSISLLSASLMYDRVVDGNPASVTVPSSAIVDGNGNDYYFTIFGGGYAVNTAITMFDTNLTNNNATLPCVQLLKFNSVKFESLNSADAAYVMSPKLLRIVFEGCSYRKIKCLSAPTILTQSIYFFACQARRWVGDFFSSQNVAFDLKVQGSLMEAGGDGFDLVFPVGCSFIGSTIEGMDTYAIKYSGAQALLIDGNYFEANGIGVSGGGSIDGSDLTRTNESITLSSNYLSGDATDRSKAQVLWGINRTAVSNGNYCNTTLHNFNAASNVNVIGDDAILALSSNATRTITGITQANPAVVTSTGHGKKTGDLVAIFDVVGMTEVNTLQVVVGAVTANTFELAGVNSTAYTAYSSGGKCYAPTSNIRTEINSGALIRSPTQYTYGGKIYATFVGGDGGNLHLRSYSDEAESPAGIDINAAGNVTISGDTHCTGDLVQLPSSTITPATDGELTIEATANTTLTFKLKGTDSTVRTGTITLS
jgi:hypothetical protein